MSKYPTPSERGRNAKEAIEYLKSIEDPFVNSNILAPCMGMSPSVLRKHVRDGEYKLSAYDIQGGRIRFSRKDFLQKIGEIPEDPEEPTDRLVLVAMIEAMEQILKTQKMMLELLNEQNDILRNGISPAEAIRLHNRRKTAGAATPTD